MLNRRSSGVIGFAALAALATGIVLWPSADLVAQTPAKPTPPAAAAKQAAAPAQPAAPAGPVRVETFLQDSWTVSCQEMATGPKKTCSATLQVVDDKRQVLFGWVIGKTPEGVLTGVFQTPTGTLVQRGVELKIGNATTPRKANYVACTNQRCEASLPLDDAFIKEASASPTALAAVYLVDGRTVNYKLNTKGFDKAVAAIVK